jgi:dTDP-glucose 4,6-dehydratase
MTRNIPYKGFLNFSSSSVTLPYETFYSATKAAGERLVRAFVNKYDKPVFSVRPYTVIGVGEQSEHLVPKLIHSCLTQSEMPFVKDATHDFIGVNDLCNAVITLMQYADKLKGQIVDIGTGVSTTNNEVLKIVEKLTKKKANIKLVKSLRPYDTKDWKADPGVLELLGWIPHKLESIIEDMVNAMIAETR